MKTNSAILFAIGGMNLFGDSYLNETSFNKKFKSAYGTYGGPFNLGSARPRTVIGYNSNTNKVILAVIYRENKENMDGKKILSKSTTNRHLTLFETRQIMKYLHCDMILNLDGGGSSCISFKNKDDNENDYIYNGTSTVLSRININSIYNDQIVWTE